MLSSIGFQILSLIYMILVAIVFYSKKKVDTAENRIFSLLVIANIIGASMDIVSVVLAFWNPDSIITVIACKLYLVYLSGYMILFSEYTLLITNTQYNCEQKLEKYKNLTSFILISFTICASILLAIPINIYVSATSVYTYGAGVNLTYAICLSCAVLWVFLLIKGRKHLTLNRVLPIFATIIFDTITAAIQFTHPEILIITSAYVLTTIVMYFTVFTVENPDAEMVKEIQEARKEAEQANKSKSDFLSNMSHEIRTPLNAILGFSQGLLDEKLTSAAREEVEDIISASDSLLEIVNEILDISKIESNKLEIINVEYSINKIYRYLVTMTEGRIGSRSLSFIHKCDGDIPPVLYGDSVRIKQVAVNLLTNAVKYTQEGSVKFLLEHKKIDSQKCQLIITVEDTGIGLKEEDVAKLFTKFERFDLKKNNSIEGTGLGLALTKTLVDLMGGEIKVESKYGEGSKFVVTLEQGVVDKSLDEIENSNITEKSFNGNGERILVVDDNSVNLKVASKLLKKYNVKIETCKSGQDCISKVLNGEKYDLILLDDLMPGMSGGETLNYLKQIEYYNIPTVALTANAISGMKEKYISEGFDDYIAKPIDSQQLEEVLSHVLVSNKKEDNLIEGDLEKSAPSGFVEDDNFTESNIEILDVDSDAVSVDARSTKTEKHDIEFLKSNGVDVDQSLEFLGDIDMYNETIEEFIQGIDDRINDITKYKIVHDLNNYRILVHSLKSDSKYLGFTKLAELAYNHEIAAKNNDSNYIDDNFDELICEADRNINLAKKYVARKGI